MKQRKKLVFLFIVRQNEVGGHVAHNGTYAFRILVRKPEGRRLLERPRYRGENSIKIIVR